MYSIDYTHQFKKDLRKCAKRGLDIDAINEVNPESWTQLSGFITSSPVTFIYALTSFPQDSAIGSLPGD